MWFLQRYIYLCCRITVGIKEIYGLIVRCRIKIIKEIRAGGAYQAGLFYEDKLVKEDTFGVSTYIRLLAI